MGGSGADQLYGGVGHNTFGDERDGFEDRLYFKSDQFAYNWFYGKAGNNPTGQKVDVIKGLDANDKLYIREFRLLNCPSAMSMSFLHLLVFFRV